MSGATPTFAVVGAVNHGKSSVVSTLAEDDCVRISPMPGETIECQQFWLDDLFRFWDTPGFQNAIEACEELEPARQAIDPLRVFREFVERHRGAPEFDAECRLLQPIIEGAGIIYVVDGSRELIPFHFAEMEILRLTGQPRLAIINRTDCDDHVGEWKQKLGAHFNAVREFNAHQATFADRLELLETLAGIDQLWKPKLTRAVAIFKEEYQHRIDACAAVISELLIESLQHREDAPLESDRAAQRVRQGEALRERFVKSIADREFRTHAQLIELFRHHRVKREAAGGLEFDQGLFSSETWRLFGLGEKQLVMTATLGGAAAGAALDLVTAGHTLLAGAAIGGTVGAVGGYFLGKKRPELKVNLLGSLDPSGKRGIELAGRRLSVGPYAAANFPWILLDRAVGTFYFVVNRAHARQDHVTINSAEVRQRMEAAGIATSQWPGEVRKQCERVFTAIRRDKLSRDDHDQLHRLIRLQLARAASETTSPDPDAAKPRG
jgi:GTPase Era involved in 16S rRNA processing